MLVGPMNTSSSDGKREEVIEGAAGEGWELRASNEEEGEGREEREEWAERRAGITIFSGFRSMEEGVGEGETDGGGVAAAEGAGSMGMAS
jgi:hypothetical protein